MLVDFYFGPGSRYSYLAATQLDALARETSAEFRWRPLFSADLIARTGGPRSPQDPDYRRTDVERWARLHGVPFHEPDGSSDWRRLALACVAADALGAVEPFSRALFAALYGQGKRIDDHVLADVAVATGLDAALLLAGVESETVATAYARNLSDALAVGAWGVPTFVTPDGELFWGQDRLPLLRDHLLSAA